MGVGIRSHELFAVAQGARVQALREQIPTWLARLEESEQLVIGFPRIGNQWRYSHPMAVPPGTTEESLDAWLLKHAGMIHGTRSQAGDPSGFLLMVAGSDFDPRTADLSEGSPPELREFMESFGYTLTFQEIMGSTKAA